MAEIGLGGNTPQLNRSGETPGSKALFHSVRDIALILDKTFKPGYGYLKAGTIMAENSADALLVPYPETEITDNFGHAKAFLVADTGATGTTVQVVNAEAYKFAVGDSLVILDDTTAAEDLGAITDITMAVNGTATITVTTAIGGAAYTVARNAFVTCKSDTAAGFTKAKYVLDQDINTGYGETALGANASVVLNNAVLYLASIVNYDAQAGTDLGAVIDNRFLILK